ncbi:MAG: DUF4878 domain-containing protein [Actinomycetota bacterium]|nr:DUF4878 domain-containing protein [Actinomycetota bacterium]MDQ5807685.1 DUF4878 domain-containing protein [Actinomycetota bacterium]
MPRQLLLALLVAALALGGCGGAADSDQEFEGVQRDVARTIEDLEEAGQEDEPRRICQALLARELVQNIEDAGGSCEEAIQKALDQTDTFALTVEKVDVRGTTATVSVETGVDEEQLETVELVKEGDAWKISGLPGAG